MTLKLVDQGGDPAEIRNSQNRPLYKSVSIYWSTPQPLSKTGDIILPEEFLEPGYLYALVRNHGNARLKDRIVYVGITNNLKQRFKSHPKADKIRAAKGQTGLSIGEIQFGSYRTAKTTGNRRAIEELEHIFIWTLWHDLWNKKKQFTLPGMGKNGGRAWDIITEGYTFSGRMPRRIVYPWIMIDPRRDRTVRSQG